MAFFPFQKKVRVEEALSLGGHGPCWRVHAGRVVGEGHRARGERCQDAYFYHAWEDRLVLVLADGAGSAPHAAVGSRLAVNVAGRSAVDAVSRGKPLVETAELAVASARAALEQQPYPLRDLACTFLLALWCPAECVVLQIGDGWIVLIEPERCRAAFRPRRGEYANQTYFLTQRDWREHMQLETVDQADKLIGLALLSDGLEQATVDLATATPSHSFFSGYAKALLSEDMSPRAQKQALLAFLKNERVAATSDDDKTLVMAVRCSVPPANQVSTVPVPMSDGKA